MKIFVLSALAFLSSCGAGTIVPAKSGYVACRSIIFPFKGDVLLQDGWAVVTPQRDKDAKKAILSSDCVILVSDED